MSPSPWPPSTGPHSRPASSTRHPAIACLSWLSGWRLSTRLAWAVSRCDLWPWMCHPSSALKSSCQQETRRDTSFHTFSPLLFFPPPCRSITFPASHLHFTLLCWHCAETGTFNLGLNNDLEFALMSLSVCVFSFYFFVLIISELPKIFCQSFVCVVLFFTHLSPGLIKSTTSNWSIRKSLHKTSLR